MDLNRYHAAVRAANRTAMRALAGASVRVPLQDSSYRKPASPAGNGACTPKHMEDALGWTSSLVLLATILTQIRKQWSERSGEGVSTWLFVGQTAASAGFTAYSGLVHNWVFMVTNALLLLSNLLGWGITAYFKRQEGRLPSRGEVQRVSVI